MELAVPLIALGSMYVISNQKDKGKGKGKEGYTNMDQVRNVLPGVNPPRPAINFPILEPVTSNNNINAYKNSNQYTDKYFDAAQYAEHEKRQTANYGVGGSVQTSYSLTGQPIDKEKFKHHLFYLIKK